ncbi:MAG: hypothetical protein H0T46_18075 [Deltaproteobacteria bacterium]|nr:hypothetical protein [Deltaproteobacteria bacterium]
MGCIDTRRLADASTAEGVQASCEAVVVHDGGREAVPMCPADGACVELVPNDPACGLAPYVRAVLRDSSVTDGQLQVYCELPHVPT